MQYERSGIGGLAGASKKKDKKIPKNELAVLAKKYSGEDNGLIAEKSRRDQVLVHSMRERAFQLTARRVSQENSSGKTPGPTTSIFKLVGANLARDFTEIKSDLMGVKGIGWEGDGFSEREIESTRSWLNTRAVTIYGGTNEVQMNINSKARSWTSRLTLKSVRVTTGNIAESKKDSRSLSNGLIVAYASS